MFSFGWSSRNEPMLTNLSRISTSQFPYQNFTRKCTKVEYSPSTKTSYGLWYALFVVDVIEQALFTDDQEAHSSDEMSNRRERMASNGCNLKNSQSGSLPTIVDICESPTSLIFIQRKNHAFTRIIPYC